MSEEPEDLIACTALQPGTPVQTRDGVPFATVQRVRVDAKVLVFDGVLVLSATGTGLADRGGAP